MQQAIELAKQAELLGEVPVGAVIVKDDQVIGQGFNQPITNHDPSAHAEIIAIRDAAKNLANYRLCDTTLYVTLEPCTMCLGAIFHARIKYLVFGAYDPKAGVCQSVLQLADQEKLNHHLTWEGGVMAQECGALLTEFFRKKRG